MTFCLYLIKDSNSNPLCTKKYLTTSRKDVSWSCKIYLLGFMWNSIIDLAVIKVYIHLYIVDNYNKTPSNLKIVSIHSRMKKN